MASTFGVLGAVSRKYAHRIPFIVKLNHNELMTYPTTFDQIMFAQVKDAFNLGAAGVGATIYFGSDESMRQLQEVTEAFSYAHELGMFTVLWCYLRNPAFKADKDYHTSADMTGQANHLGVTIEADIIKQKLPDCNGGFNTLKFAKTNPKVYSELTTDNPIDLTRYRSEEHTSELQSHSFISYAVFCLKKKRKSTRLNSCHIPLYRIPSSA